MTKQMRKAGNTTVLDLSRLALMVHAEQNPDGIFSVLASSIRAHSGYHRFSVYLYDEQSYTITYFRSRKKRSSPIPEFPVQGDLLQWIIQTGTNRVVPFEWICPSINGFSALLFPLIAHGRLIGVMQIIVKKTADQILQEYLELYDCVAEHAAIAFSNALYTNSLHKENIQLRELHVGLSTYLDAQSFGVMLLNKSNHVIFLNSRVRDLLTIRNESPAKLKDCVSSKLRRIISTLIKQAESDVSSEIITEHPEDNSVPLLLRLSVLHDVSNDNSYYQITVYDNTNVDKLITAAEVDRLKSHFLAAVSHEFKTPLNLILGSTSILLEELVGILNDRQRKLILLIQNGGNRLFELIRSLLEMSRLEADKGQFAAVDIDLKQLIAVVCTAFNDMARQKKVTVSTEYGSDCAIQGDKDSLVRLLGNIIHNAIKFNHDGGRVRISVDNWEKDSKGRFVAITVQDNGIGISEHDKNFIFKEFHRSYDSFMHGEQEGCGLGLTVAKKVVDLHRGKIIVNSEQDAGTSVTIVLPKKLHNPIED